MRHVVLACAPILILTLLCHRPAAASGDDEVATLKAKIEKLEAENKALKQQIAKLTEQLVAQKKPPTGAEAVIDIDGSDDITIGETKHTLSSLRKLMASSPPSQVTVRKKGSTTGKLGMDMDAFLQKNGYTKDSEVGNEQVWVPSAPPPKKP